MNTDELFSKIAAFISDLHNIESTLTNNNPGSDLTPLQNQLLKILYFASPRTLSSLSGCMNMNMPNTSREVKKLTQKKLIIKNHSKGDKRTIELYLTEKGKGTVEQDLEYMKSEFIRRSGEWKSERIKRVIDSIDELRQELII